MRKFLDGLYLFAGYAAGGFLILIFALMMLLAVGRPLGINIPAGDDLVAWCMAAMSFLGLAHTFRSGEMIRVGLLLERLPPGRRHVAEVAALTVAAGFVVYFARHAVQMTYDSFRFNDMAQGVLAVPLWIPQLGFSGGIVILAVALVDELWHVARGGQPNYEKARSGETPDEFVERIAQGGGG